MKPKQANTLQQKLGFNDEDLKKPLHDDIMFKLNSKIDDIVNNLFFKPLSDQEIEVLKNKATKIIEKFSADRSKLIECYQERIENYKNGNLDEDTSKSIKDYEGKIQIELEKINKYKNLHDFKGKVERPRIKLKQKIWEMPVTTQSQYSSGSSSKYTVGFIDMAVCFDLVNFDIGGENEEFDTDCLSKWVMNIKDNLFFRTLSEEKWLFIEVKTEIKSVGELIRQIQHYKEYRSGSYYILCPDNKYKDILAEQGIGTIEI